MHDTTTEVTELPDSMWVVARRPKWIAMLVFALVVAAVFAYLGHWQLDRSVQSLKPVTTGSETRKVLSDVTKPQTEFLDKLEGQKVSVEGTFVKDDFRVISDRVNYGKTGYWLVGRFVDNSNNASVAVALGWSSTSQGARSAISAVPAAPTVLDLGGRYLPTEDVDDGNFTAGQETVLSVPELINEWNDFSGDAYNGYIVADRSWGALDSIYSPPPIDKATLNWLNVFYAVEWVVFAGFAIYLWYRLVRDTYERELEEAEEAASLVASGPGSGSGAGPGSGADSPPIRD